MYSLQVQYRESNYCFQAHQEIAVSRQGNLSISAEIDCQKQRTHCLRLHFIDFATENLFLILVVSVSRRRSRSYSLESGCPDCFVKWCSFHSTILSLENDGSSLQLITM